MTYCNVNANQVYKSGRSQNAGARQRQGILLRLKEKLRNALLVTGLV